MTQDLFNNILAIIGTITGLSGLLVSLYLLNKQKIRFVVYHPTYEDRSSYVGFNATYIGRSEYGDLNFLYTPYLFLIWLQITNKSSSHTTILEMSLKIPNNDESILYSRTSDDFNITNEYTVDGNGNIEVKSGYYISDILKPPIAVESFSTIEGYFYFRNLNISSDKPITAVLKIKTPQGSSKNKIIIKPRFPTLIE